MGKLLDTILRDAHAVLDAMRSISKGLMEWLHSLEQIGLRGLMSPDLLVTFLYSLAIAVATVAIISALHLAPKLVHRRRTAVFISYQHHRESEAADLSKTLASGGILATRFPFVAAPEHDDVLDRVKRAIQACDVFVCLPGNAPSFVEIEVAMAFALGKPLLFVVTSDESPRLPNTAKKGYPIFVLDRLQRSGYRSLVAFCSYLAADLRSSVDIYAAALRHLRVCAVFVIGVFAADVLLVGTYQSTHSHALTATVWASSPSELVSKLLANPALLWCTLSSLLLLLIPYSVYLGSRFVIRNKLARGIVSRRFAHSLIPETMSRRLGREQLLADLYHGDVLAEHEAEDLASAQVVRAEQEDSSEPDVPAPRYSRLRFIAKVVAVLLLLGCLSALPFGVSSYRTFQFTMVLIYAIVLIGLNIPTIYTGVISLGQGAFYAVGAYTTAILMDHIAVPYWIAIPMSGVVCGTFGLLFALPAVRAPGNYLALTTFALAVALPQILKDEHIDQLTGGVGGIVITRPDPPVDLPVNQDQWFFLLSLVVTVLMFALARNLIHSKVGRALVAIRDDPIAAGAVGIDAPYYKAAAFGISAVYAGIGGSLGAIVVQFVAPDSFTAGLSILFLVGVVMGGFGLMSSAVFGALFIQFVPNSFDQVSKAAPWLIFGIFTLAFAYGLQRAATRFPRMLFSHLNSLARTLRRSPQARVRTNRRHIESRE